MRISVPGKLFLMGEYSVMHAGNPAIIVAVNKFLHAEIKESTDYQFTSEQGSFKWILDQNIPVLRYDMLIHAKAALNIAFQYLSYLKIVPKKFHLDVISELNHHDGIKYGLGSSGAIMIAVIKAILSYHQVPLDDMKIFKLAVLAQLDIKDVTSGGELAASLYGGWVYYERYDLLWVINNRGLAMKLIDLKWPKLTINHLEVDHYKVAICFTGISKSTKDYLDKVASKDLKSGFYKKFLETGKTLVLRFKEALLKQNDQVVYESIDAYRNLMLDLQTWAGIEIESTAFTTLIDSAHQYGYHAKISGAGFGDCGIAVLNEQEAFEPLLNIWSHQNFFPLNLKVWEIHHAN